MQMKARKRIYREQLFGVRRHAKDAKIGYG